MLLFPTALQSGMAPPKGKCSIPRDIHIPSGPLEAPKGQMPHFPSLIIVPVDDSDRGPPNASLVPAHKSVTPYYASQKDGRTIHEGIWFMTHSCF